MPSVAIDIQKVYPDIPDDQLECKNIPIPGRKEKQSQVALYVTNLMEAAVDCKSSLRDVKVLFENFKDGNITNVSEIE